MSWLKGIADVLDGLGGQGHDELKPRNLRHSKAIASFYGPDGVAYDVFPAPRGRCFVAGPQGPLPGSFADIDEARASISELGEGASS